jgi:hypothetical protein
MKKISVPGCTPKQAITCHLCRASAPAASWHALACGFARHAGFRLMKIDERIPWNFSRGRRTRKLTAWLCPICLSIYAEVLQEQAQAQGQGQTQCH